MMVSFSPPPTTNEVEQVGVQTPSTAPRATNRLQQPLQQSPFTPQTNNETIQQLSKHQLNEIKTIFQLFDPSLSGYVDIPTFEIMLHSLGYRITQSDIVNILDDIISDEDTNHRQGASASSSTRIDLQLAIQILVTKGYTTNRSNSSIEDEIQTYFQSFDCNNKGYITLHDLKRVHEEVENENDDGSINDEMLQSMINQFDTTHNGVIGYDEFKTILKPVLSHHMD